MKLFQTYKVQYEEAMNQLTTSSKQVEELNAKLVLLEKENKELAAKVGEQLISKEDLDKLMLEHGEFAKANKELATQVESLKAEVKDVEEASAKKAQEILSGIGIKAPIAVKPDDTAAAEDNDNPFIKVLFKKK